MKNMKISIALLLLVTMVVSVVGCGAQETTAPKEEKTSTTSSASVETEYVEIQEMEPVEETETEQTYDVVVIGAGGAGLSAAIAAAEKGANVVMLEQRSVVGGNTSWSGAGMDIPENWVQEAQGIEDSKELYIDDTMKGGDGTNIKELVNTLAENALPTAEWLRDTVGVEFMDDFQKHFGGHTVARAIVVKGGVGSQMILKELEKALELGVTIKANTKAESLIQDESGRVVSVTAQNTLGQDLTFNANKGVVIASGGFAGNVEMRSKYRPELDDSVKTTNTPGHNGDGIVMAQELGADTTHMEFIQTYPFAFPTTGKITFVADTRMYGAPMVNIEGNRFINENDRRDVISKAILSQSDGFGYMVWDESILTEARTLEIYGEEYEQLISDEVLVKADTLEEAADFFGINKDELAKTIQNYNSYATDAIENGTDTKVADKEFQRNAKMATVEKGPFYIQKVIPSVHHTMGGLVINPDGSVKNTDGDTIPGLYAAGEVVGGIHGNNRLGGNALTDISVFGKIAGESAAQAE